MPCDPFLWGKATILTLTEELDLVWGELIYGAGHMGGVAMEGGVPYQSIRGLNFLRSLGGRDCLWGAVQLRKAHVEPSSPFRPPPPLTLTFCLLPVGGGAQVHLRRHGQGGPGAHPTSPPHRRCRPSPNSRWARRAGAVGAQGRRGAARTAAGSPGTRRGAGPGARGAE